MPKLISYQYLYTKYGIEKNKAINIAYRLQIPRIRKRVKRGVRVYFTEENAQKIIDWRPIQQSSEKKHHRRKITIIEAYIEKPTVKGVARTLRINHESVRAAVKEWEDTGCITVESSLNKKADLTYKGVQKRGSKWMYDVRIDRKRYWKLGFKTEEEAFEALQKLRTQK